jgi:SAM-dependent methyltransferase
MVKDSNNSWFTEWFNTPYYHMLYKHRDEAEAELFIRNITRFLNLDKSTHVLDLACGKGRHALFFSQLGFKVKGLDLSINSIETARKNSNDRLDYAVHDMREVYSKDTFDAIFNLFTSFGYFDAKDDNLKVLQSIHEMLKDNGVLVIDFMNAQKVIESLVSEEIKEVDGTQFYLTRSYDGTHIFKNIQFDDNGEHFDFTERVQALTKADFELLLENANFEVMNAFGNYQLDPFNESTSDRLILISRKK